MTTLLGGILQLLLTEADAILIDQRFGNKCNTSAPWLGTCHSVLCVTAGVICGGHADSRFHYGDQFAVLPAASCLENRRLQAGLIAAFQYPKGRTGNLERDFIQALAARGHGTEPDSQLIHFRSKGALGFQHPVRLYLPKSKSQKFLSSSGEKVLASFPVQATIHFYNDDTDSEEDEENSSA
ncbi:protein ripply3 isoform X1 [Apus apus]|uniref:protein ripply3 isoform X1 n=1 Tax=Apus apus TaxID=8895 RepID=UPI0021F84CF8|nr:protein ripply3 isoform X1 [Apus apus]